MSIHITKKILGNEIVSYFLTLLIVAAIVNISSSTFNTYQKNRIYKADLREYVDIRDVQMKDVTTSSFDQIGMTIRSVKRNMKTDIYHEPACLDYESGDFIKLQNDFVVVDKNIPVEKVLDPKTGEEILEVKWRLPLSDELRAKFKPGDYCGWYISYEFYMPDGTKRPYPITFFPKFFVLDEQPESRLSKVIN